MRTRENKMGFDFLRALFSRSLSELTKLNTLLEHTVTRLAHLRNQRQTRCAHAHADVAHLLQLGDQDRALLCMEIVIKERNMVDVLAMVESYCHLLIERAFLLHNQRECPKELREAAVRLLYAASRCRDLPELREIFRIFSCRFGKEFNFAATELRNNCGVSGMMEQKFSSRQPSLKIGAEVTKEITVNNDINVKITEPNSETAQNPNLQRKKQAKEAMEPPCTSCDMFELLGGDKLVRMIKEK